MVRCAALLIGVAGVAMLAGVSCGEAQDASFGCKVLLCAAANNPSWSGIAYCVPVMQSLFHSLAHGGSWPNCSEGNASGLGYEPYQACPAGLTAVQSASDGNNGYSAVPNGNLCADLSKPSQTCSGDNGCTTEYPTTPRQARNDPYFVDITTANGVQRVYFSLQGY